jgi:undecaprenyl-diphosphatase
MTGMVPAVLDTYSPARVRRSRIRAVCSQHSWLLRSATLLIAVIAMRRLLSQHPFPGDAWAARLGASHKPWLIYAITRVYQQVGRPLVAVGEVLVILAWLWRSSGRRTARGLLIALLASFTCGLIKTICGPTPLWLSLHHVGTNFPSGVVTFVTAVGGYLGVVALRQGHRTTWMVLMVVIAGAGPARVLGGQHLLSDVLGGYMLGAAWLIAAYAYMVRPERRAHEEAAWGVTSVKVPA